MNWNSCAICADVEARLHVSSTGLDLTSAVLGSRVLSGTARRNAGAYSCNMQLPIFKSIVAMLWVSAVTIVGIARTVDSFSSWTVLAGVAVVPPLVMLWRWNDPRQTMSESIQEALR
jgi:hypothetical protein